MARHGRIMLSLTVALAAPLALTLAAPVPALAQSATEGVADRLAQAACDHADAIDVRDAHLTYDEVSALMSDTYATEPAWVAVDDALILTNHGEVTQVSLTYRWDEATSRERVRRVTLALADAARYVPEGADVPTRAKALHDYLVTHATYGYLFDRKNPTDVYDDSATCAWGPLVAGWGNCVGYARAYQLLCSSQGIPCRIVHSSDMRHVWNAIEVDGTWYHVDACSDDPIVSGSTAHGGTDREDLGWAPLDTTFLRSDAYLRAHGHKGFSATAPSTRFDTATWPVYDQPQRACAVYRGFTDIDPTAWYMTSDVIDRALDEGLLHGYSATTLAPDAPMTRAELICVIARAAHAPTDAVDVDGLVDVRPTDWCAGPVTWAVEHGLVNPQTGRVRPNDAVTREEAATILMNLAGRTGNATDLVGVTDASSISPWAHGRVAAAAACGVLTGSNGTLRPRDVCTRAEGAALIERMCDQGLIAP